MELFKNNRILEIYSRRALLAFVLLIFGGILFSAKPVFCAELFGKSESLKKQETKTNVQKDGKPEGFGDPSGMKGTEITTEDLKKYFPDPLSRSASNIGFQPEPAPFFSAPLSSPRVPSSAITPEPTPYPKAAQKAASTSAPVSLPPADTLHVQQKSVDLQVRSTPGLQTPSPGPFIQSPLAPAKGKSIGAPQTSAQQTVQEHGAGNTSRTTKTPKGIPLEPDLATMVGQMLLVGFAGVELKNDAPVLGWLREGKIGGVVLLPRNIVSPSQVRVLTATLQKAAQDDKGIPLLIAVEQEGGLAQVLTQDKGFEGGPALAVLGRGSTLATEISSRRMALEISALGCNMNLAPVADIDVNPLNEEITKKFRSFGADPQNVAAHVYAFGKGHAAVKVIPCLKYFPGVGSIMGAALIPRGGMVIPPDMSASWSSRELHPYIKVLQQGWPGAVMAASVYDRSMDALYPVTLSQQILTGLLREKMGFKGVVLSYDLEVLTPLYRLEDAILEAVRAGADIIFLPAKNSETPEIAVTAHEILLRLAREGRISHERLRQSWQRIVNLKKPFLYGTPTIP